MRLTQVRRGYNPYNVEVNGMHVELQNIAVYGEHGVICKTGRGWFGNNGNQIGNVEIEGEVLLRRKQLFDGSVFVMAGDKENMESKTRYVLYVPNSMLRLWRRYKIRDFYLFESWVNDNSPTNDKLNSIEIDTVIQDFNKEPKDIAYSIDDIGKEITSYKLMNNPMEFDTTLSLIALKKLQYHESIKKRDDTIKEIKNIYSIKDSEHKTEDEP